MSLSPLVFCLSHSYSWRGLDLSNHHRPSDPSEFSFSKKQNEIFAGWKRPAEIFNDSGPELFENIMVAKTNSDLVQDITTDCSVVASLCAVMRHLNPNKKDSVSLPRTPLPETLTQCSPDNVQAAANVTIPLRLRQEQTHSFTKWKVHVSPQLQRLLPPGGR